MASGLKIAVDLEVPSRLAVGGHVRMGRRRGGLCAVRALVPGDSLGYLLLVACLFRCRIRGGLGTPLRDGAGSLGRPKIKAGIKSSGRGGNHGRVTS